MSTTIQDRHGNSVEVYVAINGRQVDAIVRADTQSDFETAALDQKLTVQDEDGIVSDAPGVNIRRIGSVVTQWGEDEEGNRIALATDNRYHVNIRITEPALSAVDEEGFENWKQTAIDWTTYGTPDTAINAEEQGLKLSNVVLIDPETIKTPVDVWA